MAQAQVNFEIDETLLKRFDNSLKSLGYYQRSEAMRDLIRKSVDSVKEDKVSQEQEASE